MLRDVASLVDMLTAARLAREFASGVDKGAFLADQMRQAAVIREVEILGEAAKRMSDGFRQSHSDIPWRKIAGMRDILIHAYDHVDIESLWNVVCVSIPELIERLELLVPAEDGDSDTDRNA